MPSGVKVEKRKRVNLTVSQKLELIKKLENGVPVKRVCEQYGVRKQTVSDIRKAKSKLKEYAGKYSIDGCSTRSGSQTPRKYMKLGSHKELDELVYKWYVEQKACGTKVTNGTMRSACEQFSKHLGIQCNASDGWLWRFRNRHGLHDAQVRGGTGRAGTASAEVYRVKLNELIKKEGLLTCQVYNADETGLFWRSLPNNTRACQDEEVIRGKKMCKERISALCCANADGMHRHKLVVVGKSAHPCVLKDHMHTLPVHYYHSKKAWFNASIFSDWFYKHFVPEVRRYQEDILKFHPDDVKALLLLDHAPVHPSADKLVSADGRIRVMYLPANTTSLIQPMDQGIISACKRRYQRRYLNEVMVVAENGQDIESDTRRLHTLQNIKNYTIKSAIFNLANSWKDLKIFTIANSWKKLLIDAEPNCDFEGFEATDFHRVLQRAGEKEVTLEDVQDWLDENESDPGYQVLSDEEIVAEVSNTQESSSSDEEDEMTVKLPKLSEVRCCMDTVLQFVEHTKNRDISVLYGSLKILREAIIKEQLQSGKQLKLDGVFKPVQTLPSPDSPEALASPPSPSPSEQPASSSQCSRTMDTSAPPAQPTTNSTLQLHSRVSEYISETPLCDHGITTTPLHHPWNAMTTAYHDIKEEPASPPSDDPLAMLSQEENRLRKVNGCEVLPRVYIRDMNQSFTSSLGPTVFHNSTINPDLDPSISDSEPSVIIKELLTEDIKFEYDFIGFNGKVNKDIMAGNISWAN